MVYQFHRPIAFGFFVQISQLSAGANNLGDGYGRAGLCQRFIGPVQVQQITLNSLVDLAKLLLQFSTGEVLGLAIHCLEPAAINGNDIAVQQFDVTA